VSKVGVPPCFFKKLPENIENAKMLLIGESKCFEIEILERYLKDWGLECTIAPDGGTALEFLSKDPQTFELIFISSNLPDIGSSKLHKMINNTELSGNAQAIILSPKKVTGDRFTTLSVPIRKSKLFEVLRKFSSRRNALPRSR